MATSVTSVASPLPQAVADPPRPRIVAFAFECAPGRGSEAGAGFVWARLLSRIGDATVLVPPSVDVEELRAYLADRDDERPGSLRFVVVEGSRRVRRWLGDDPWPPLLYLEYALWQHRAARRARRLHEDQAFDLSWHLTWANAWFGSLAGTVGPPFVYGPVGAGTGTPWRLLTAVGLRGAVGEVTRTIARTVGRYINPISRRAIADAALILAQNPETIDWLPAGRRDIAVVLPHVVLESAPAERPATRPARRRALFAGRLHGWKGGELAIRTVALLPDHGLIVCGDGPDLPRLRRLAARYGVADRVEFRGWTTREELDRIMRDEVSTFLFPSLHDEGGWVVAEAIAHGLPVICLDRGGPPELGGTPVSATWPGPTVRRLAQAIIDLDGTVPDPGPLRDLDEATEEVCRVLTDHGLLGGDVRSR